MGIQRKDLDIAVRELERLTDVRTDTKKGESIVGECGPKEIGRAADTSSSGTRCDGSSR